jgi:hypothetical protein
MYIIDACQYRKAYAQRIYIGPTLKAFLALEKWYFCKGINWLSSKWGILRYTTWTYRVISKYCLLDHAIAVVLYE